MTPGKNGEVFIQLFNTEILIKNCFKGKQKEIEEHIRAKYKGAPFERPDTKKWIKGK
eukprot:jgi/Botrbrau1/10915/Bobra.0025s0088.1